MTISSTTNRAAFTGNGATTSFSFPYYVIAAADLKVYVDGVLQTITTHYTLSGSAPYTAGTNVQFVSAPAAAASVVIIRDPAITQSVDPVEGDPLPVDTVIERPLDKLTMIAQRLADKLARTIQLADTDVSGASVEVPTPAANALLGWNAAGDALENKVAADIDLAVVTAFVEALLDDPDAATFLTTLGVSAFIQTLLNDADAATARTTLGAAALASPTFTGTPAAPTAAADTNTTQLATTAFVLAQAATKSDQETASSTTKLVTSGRQHSHPSAAKGWVEANNTGGATASYNVSSVSDNGVGDATINWSTPFSGSSSFAPLACSRSDAAASHITSVANSTTSASSLRILVRDTGASAQDPDQFCAVAFGAQ